MDKKSILFYINALNGGGAERVMVNLATQFSDCGYKVMLATSYRDKGEYEVSSKVERLSLENEQIIQSKIMRNYTRIKKLRKIIKEKKPDVLITFMREPNFRGMISTIGTTTKNIISVRNDPRKEYVGKGNYLIAKYLLPRADGCVFQTKEAQEWFSQELQRKSKVIINAVNPVFYETKRNPKKNLIVTCGRLDSQKNHKNLIQAFSLIKDRIKDAILYIYGEGVLEESLQEQIDHLGIQNRVFLKGQTSDVSKALSEADLFILSSDYEGMPNALMEAMAVGVPCISTDCPCGGPRELINDGVDGLLVPVNNPNSISNGIITILENEDFKEKLAYNAKEKAKSFRPDKIFGEWKEYVDNII